MKDKKRKLILPPHKSKQNPPTLPGMTIADAEEAEKVVETEDKDSTESEGSDAEEEEELELFSTSEDVAEAEFLSDDEDGKGDVEAREDKDGASASKKAGKQPEIIVLSDDSVTESESGDGQ